MSVHAVALGDQLSLTPHQFVGIPLAVVGAIFLSIGAQLQHRGVVKVEESSGAANGGALNSRQLTLLITRPSWLIGTLMLGLAIVFQLGSLYFAPLLVVQPIGAIALVITTFVNSRVARVQLPTIALIAVGMCVLGIFVFVSVAATSAVDRPIHDGQLLVILAMLLVALLAAGAAFRFLRSRLRAIMYVSLAGVLYGFVATLAKVVLGRIQQGGFEWLTVSCLIGLVIATSLGGYFVQNAHASGPPDLVIAGLTVVDPLVAVSIGILVLNEAASASSGVIVTFVISGGIAVIGVVLLAQFHPQARGEDEVASSAANDNRE